MAKYKVYILSFSGSDPGTIEFLTARVAKRYPQLGAARKVGRAAKLLFGVEYQVDSITRAKPVRWTVQSL